MSQFENISANSFEELDEFIRGNFNVTEFINGHQKNIGKDSGLTKNPIWKIEDNGKVSLLMFCEKNTVCKLCPESHEKIKEFEIKRNDKKCLTFFLHSNGYISCNPSVYNTTNLYIHQIITGCYGNGKGTNVMSVDHIDRNPLNNRFDNLRIATRKEQEENSNGIMDETKRNRKKNAQQLPAGLLQHDLPKYVTYNSEVYNKEKQLIREFFRIEKHPKSSKSWSSSKSTKISIQEKLNETNQALAKIENDSSPEKKREFPQYISLKIERKKPHLIYDRRIPDEKRRTMRMVLPESYNDSLQKHIDDFTKKIRDKYGTV